MVKKNDEVGATGGCPNASDGVHAVEWIEQPSQFRNGRQVHPPLWRGICWDCGERFVVDRRPDGA